MLIDLQESKSREGYTVVAADYDDVNAVTAILLDNKVDTLVCALGVLNETTNTSQLNLIHAASKSSATRRFVIGSYDMEAKRE